jgi:hypothetical protein
MRLVPPAVGGTLSANRFVRTCRIRLSRAATVSGRAEPDVVAELEVPTACPDGWVNSQIVRIPLDVSWGVRV